LEKQGVITKKETIVDASFVEVPRLRKTKEENEIIKMKTYLQSGITSRKNSAKRISMLLGP